jgi:hypothetical protein
LIRNGRRDNSGRIHIPGAWQATRYPAVDLHQMPYGENTYDMVVHPDTLEHVV